MSEIQKIDYYSGTFIQESQRFNNISDEQLLPKEYTVRSRDNKIIREAYKMYYVING